MGGYLNPGNALFQRSLNSEIYVDKTELIRYTNSFMNTENNLMCVSRPRRFGKSMALQMLAAYYSRGCDSRELFSGLKVCDYEDEPEDREKNFYSKGWDSEKKKELFEKNLNRYNTLYLDMQGIITDILMDVKCNQEIMEFNQALLKMSSSEREMTLHPLLTMIQKRVIEELRENSEYAAVIPKEESFLGNALLAVYRYTGNQFVILIDEWDCIFRNYEDNRFLQDKYIDFLRGMFKNARLLPAFALVYMTGILPIKRYGTQSALNNFREYTMLRMSPLEEFAGFTEEETRGLYQRYGMDMEQAREWYDGYQLENVHHIYSPNSVVQSVLRHNFGSYWTATGTYESVKQPLEMNFDGLKEKVIMMLGGERCRIDTVGFNNLMTRFKNTDDVLTLLIHLGYLGYDSGKQEVYIPNKEIRDEFVRAIQSDKWSQTFAAISRSQELLEATLACDEEAVAAGISKVHEDNTSILTYNNENSLSCVIQLAYYKAQDDYWMIRELPAGKGYADIAFIPRRGVTDPAMIVELKWKKDVRTALNQIYDKNYSSRLQEYYGEVLLVGINYQKDNKTHTCRIERVYKEKN